MREPQKQKISYITEMAYGACDIFYARPLLLPRVLELLIILLRFVWE